MRRVRGVHLRAWSHIWLVPVSIILVATVGAGLHALSAGAPNGSVADVPQCLGDCGGDGQVTIDELLIMVNVALEDEPLQDCEMGDSNGDGAITIEEILTAVNNALDGCVSGAPLERGLSLLSAGNLRGATDAFAAAAAATPNDDRANLYFAITRIATKLLDDPQLKDLRQRSGIVLTGDSADVCGLDVTGPDELPAGAPRLQEIVDTLRAVLLPEVTAAIEKISRISADVTIRFNISDLPACVRPNTDVETFEIDRGDVLALNGGLDVVAAALDMLTAYNLDVGLQTAIDGSPQTVLEAQPQLLTLRSADPLAAARQHLSNGIGEVIQAIDAVRAETDDQTDDILVIDPQDAEAADRARRLLNLGQQALVGTVVLMDAGLLDQQRLNLSLLFSGQFGSLRPFLPAFKADGNFDRRQFPDPTFGNSTPDLTQDTLDHFLDGGPPCAACVDSGDCSAFGLGKFQCRSCGFNCTGQQERCSDGFRSCQDGIF